MTIFKNGIEMVDAAALNTKITSTTRDMTAGSGNVSYTGVGFDPTAFAVSALHSNGTDGSMSFVDSNASIASTFSSNGGALGGGDSTNVAYLQTAGSVVQQARSPSFISGGVTLTWTKTGAPAGTGYLAFQFMR